MYIYIYTQSPFVSPLWKQCQFSAYVQTDCQTVLHLGVILQMIMNAEPMHLCSRKKSNFS